MNYTTALVVAIVLSGCAEDPQPASAPFTPRTALQDQLDEIKESQRRIEDAQQDAEAAQNRQEANEKEEEFHRAMQPTPTGDENADQ
jgi:hypothetical protein